MDSSIRLVMLQFSFSNPDAVPGVVKRLQRETPQESGERKARGNGVMVISPTEGCSLAEFLGQLEAQSFELVDAWYQPRVDARTNRTYHSVRFTFVRTEHVANLSEAFKCARNEIRNALQEMCRVAAWRVRAFLNPFFQNQVAVDGQYAISVDLAARMPLFQSNGQPVMVWPKDERGERIGDSPVQLQPSHILQLTDTTVELSTV